MSKIAPSVLAADFGRLASDLSSADLCGIDWLHLDIMDGHFVPNISFGPAIVKTINQLSDTFLDVHLMLSEPEKYFKPFVNAGADAVTFHIEAHPDPTKYAKQLKEMGVKAGLSLNPDCPVEKVLPFLEHFDLLLVMSVFPGFGGQKFIETALDTVATIRKHIEDNNLKTEISVDGGVDAGNAARVVEAGADILVMGTAFFKADDRKEITRMVQDCRR